MLLTLSEPQFVASFDVDEDVYFFFREIALEYSDFMKKTVSRVARVCKVHETSFGICICNDCGDGCKNDSCVDFWWWYLNCRKTLVVAVCWSTNGRPIRKPGWTALFQAHSHFTLMKFVSLAHVVMLWYTKFFYWNFLFCFMFKIILRICKYSSCLL